VEIWLPRAPEAKEEASGAVLPSESVAVGAEQRSLRILLVDDHQSVRTTTAALLSDLGHEIEEASDGREALGIIERQADAFDLIITDYAMPLMSGTELIEKARQVRPDLPALIITGYADEQSIARRPEDVQVIAKPFTPDQMKNAISTASPVRELEEPIVQPIRAQA
jgi:CheY-like chemotaxis protein